MTVITEALTQKNLTERDSLVITDRYADKKKEIEHTGALNFFSDNFENIPPPPLLEMILQTKVGLKEFSQAFGITMKEMVEVLQQALHPFYIDPETLVVKVGSHFNQINQNLH